MFKALAALGYMDDLLPLIPVSARLAQRADGSPSLLTGKIGKIPGRKLFGNLWCGLSDWTALSPTPAMIERWDTWGAGIAIQSRNWPAFDIDVDEQPVADVIHSAIVSMFGAMPYRVGRWPRRLIYYRRRPNTLITKHRVVWINRAGATDAVELLGDGQQWAAYTIHPKTGKPYEWFASHGAPAGPAMLPASDAIYLDTDKVPLFFEQLLKWLSDNGYQTIKQSRSTALAHVDRRAVAQDGLRAPSIDALREALRAIPNTLDYDGWVRATAAIKGAAGPEHEADIYPDFLEWSLSYAGNTEQEALRRWSSVRAPYAVGWSLLADLAQTSGFNAARYEFSKTIDQTGAQIVLSAGDMRAAAVEAMFSRYAWVESVKRFFDTDTRALLDREQFNARMAAVGDPSESKRCAAVVYVRDLERRRVLDTITYLPGHAAIVTGDDSRPTANTWIPSPLVMPELVSDEQVSPWLEHWSFMFPNAADRETIFSWLAWIVQHPASKPNWALVLGSGAKGIGKDMGFRPVTAALGRTNYKVITSPDVTSGYTDWAASARLIVISEMKTLERTEVMARLKPLLATPPDKMRINTKYMPHYDIPNLAAFVFFTNEPDALRLEHGDRRFAVYWSDATPRPHAYYAQLSEWLDRGGEAQAARWLYQRDVTAFEAKGRAPDSAAKADMTNASMSPLEAWVSDAVATREPPFHIDIACLEDVHARVPDYVTRGSRGVSRNQVAYALRRIGAVPLGRWRPMRPFAPPVDKMDRVRFYIIRNTQYHEKMIAYPPDVVQSWYWQQVDAFNASLAAQYGLGGKK